MASQLNFDNFRNVGQALVLHNSFDIFPAIKLIQGWDVFFQDASTEFEQKENMRNKFSSCLDVEVLGMYSRAEVAKGRRALRR